jgi:GT2 family glycosyltransferase
VSIFKDISICIVTYKTNNNIYKCIKNIISFNKIFLLDNSFDLNFKKIIKKKYKKINFFLSKKNLGYGAGNNFLLKKVTSKYVLILNPDVIIKLNTIKKLYKEAESLDGNFGVMFPTCKVNISKKETLTEVQQNEFAAPLINQVEFRKINFFDSNIFFYYEDYDVCYRLKKNGKKNYMHNFAKFSHLGGKSSSSNSYDKLRNFHWGWSFFYFHNKHYGRIATLLLCFFFIVRIFLKYIYVLIIEDNKNKAKNLLLKISGILHGTFEKKDFFRKIY